MPCIKVDKARLAEAARVSEAAREAAFRATVQRRMVELKKLAKEAMVGFQFDLEEDAIIMRFFDRFELIETLNSLTSDEFEFDANKKVLINIIGEARQRQMREQLAKDVAAKLSKEELDALYEFKPR